MNILLKILIGLGIVFLYATVITIPVFFLWNWTIPDIFGLSKISFWQAMGITFLCSLLFKDNSSK